MSKVEEMFAKDFIHPLSGEKYGGFINNIDRALLKKAVDDARDELSQKGFRNDFERFVYTWRYLGEHLKKHTPAEYRKYWDLALADSGLKNAILQRFKSATSINTGSGSSIDLTGKTLFIFTIGPVQEYIAQARKTQDLYWGSYILSYLAWTAMEKVIQKYGPDSIIFPDLMEQPLCDLWLAKLLNTGMSGVEGLNTPTIPNRFFAILPARDMEEIKSLKLEEIVKCEFEKMGEYITGKLLNCSGSQKQIFGRQLKNFPDVYWVALPLERGDGSRADWEIQLEKIRGFFTVEEVKDIEEYVNPNKSRSEYEPDMGNIYGLLYSFMEKMLGARKGVRDFVQDEEKGRKCSICGEHNVVVYRCTKNEEEYIQKGKESRKIRLLMEQGAAIKKSRDKSIPYKYLSQGEGLCSLCLTKRALELYFKPIMGESCIEDDFPSTAEIALLDIIDYPDEELQSGIREYIRVFESGEDKFDYELLYKENLTRSYFEKYSLNSDQLPVLAELLEKVDKRIEKLKLNKKKYYALIKLDGDDMGRWLSGQLAPQVEGRKRLMTPSVHSSISRALRNYSILYVRKIIEESGAGKVIYSGGDDVLAVVNLNFLMDVMLKLRAAFSGHLKMGKEIIPDFATGTGFVEYEDRIDILMGGDATCSMGVAIAHYKEDLRDVIFSVHQAEEHAKKESGKNAFSIKLILRSGENYTATAKWNYPDINDREGTIGVLKKIHSFFNEGKVSTSLMVKLKASLGELELEKLPEGVFKYELKRNIWRSLNPSLSKKEKEKAAEKMYSLLYQIYREKNYDDFMNLLAILSFLNRGGEA